MSNSSGDRTASPFQPSLTTRALARIDWTQRIGAGSWDMEEAIDSFLAENASVPHLVREARLHQEKLDLYAGKSTSDVRMRLLGRVYLDDRTFKKSALLRMLQDPNARGVIALDFTKAKDFRVFMNEGRNSVLGPIKALTLGFAPKPEDIEAIGDHPLLREIEQLQIQAVPAKAWTALVASPWLAKLNNLELYLDDKIPLKSYHALANVEFEGLEGLSLRCPNWAAKSGAYEALVDAPWFDGLRNLRLESLAPAALFERLASHPVVSRLSSLCLYSCHAETDAVRTLFSRLRSCVALRVNVYRQSEPFDERLADALIEAGCVPNLMSGDAGDMRWSESALERLSAADFDLKRARARFGDQHGFFFVT